MTSRIPVRLNGNVVGHAEVDADGEVATVYFDYDSEFYSVESQITGMSIYIEEKKHDT